MTVKRAAVEVIISFITIAVLFLGVGYLVVKTGAQ